jgi:hypothetical protein
MTKERPDWERLNAATYVLASYNHDLKITGETPMQETINTLVEIIAILVEKMNNQEGK